MDVFASSNTDTTIPADFGLPPAPDLPVALARIVKLGAWWPCRDRPAFEHHEAIIKAACPYCFDEHTHGWRLGNAARTEVRWAPCGSGHYAVALDTSAQHAVDSAQPITRRA